MFLQNLEEPLERTFKDGLVLIGRSNECSTADLALNNEVVRFGKLLVRSLQVLIERQQQARFFDVCVESPRT